MSDRLWKRCERRVARFFGTHRTPLSGSNSRHTGSDTLHPRLYVEVKSVSGPSGTNAWIWRWLKEAEWTREPRCVNWLPYLYLYHSSCIPDTPAGMGVRIGIPGAGLRLYADTLAGARKEQKTPLLALFGKGKRGFWLVGQAGAILAAIKEREKVLTVEGGKVGENGKVD